MELAKRVIDAYNQRDVGILAELVTPDHEWLPAMTGLLARKSYRGREGLETYFRALSEAWEEVRIEAEEYRDLGDCVLLLGRMEARGSGSGVPVGAPLGVIFDVRGGKIARTRSFLDRAEALRAVGLEE